MPKETMTATKVRRIRPMLLVLLWVWAGCVFLTLDLFLNVREFDAIRPRASLYRGMRSVGHELVGERNHERGLLDDNGGMRHRPSAEVPATAAWSSS